MSSTNKVPSASMTLDRRHLIPPELASVQRAKPREPWRSWLETTCWRLFWVKHPHEHQGSRSPTTTLFWSRDRCRSFRPSVVLMWLIGVCRIFICEWHEGKVNLTTLFLSWRRQPSQGKTGWNHWHQERKLVSGVRMTQESLGRPVVWRSALLDPLVEVSWGFEGTGHKIGCKKI